MIYYVALFNSLFFSLTLNQQSFSSSFLFIFFLTGLINFSQDKFLKNQTTDLVLKSFTIIGSVIFLFVLEANWNIRFIFYPVPIILGLSLFNANKIKRIDPVVYLTLETIIFALSLYTWWNTTIPLALWVIFIFLNGMLIYERVMALKQKPETQENTSQEKTTPKHELKIDGKYENTLWIQGVFIFGYSISLIIY